MMCCIYKVFYSMVKTVWWNQTVLKISIFNANWMWTSSECCCLDIFELEGLKSTFSKLSPDWLKLFKTRVNKHRMGVAYIAGVGLCKYLPAISRWWQCARHRAPRTGAASQWHWSWLSRRLGSGSSVALTGSACSWHPTRGWKERKLWGSHTAVTYQWPIWLMKRADWFSYMHSLDLRKPFSGILENMVKNILMIFQD